MSLTKEITTGASPEAADFRALVDGVAEFIRGNAWRIDSPVRGRFDWLLESVVFHLTRGNMVVVFDEGQVIGVAIAWREDEDSLRSRSEADAFVWQESDPGGDSVYWALVLTSQPGLMMALTRDMVARWPAYARLKFLAHRRGRLVRRDGIIQRVLSGRRAAAGHKEER